ncbi:MAG TPA: 6-phosphogluconolactonase [Methylomirabilota bacterium]|nr:6-phosphogluconolactonase [Methylomirabilota bacterium]
MTGEPIVVVLDDPAALADEAAGRVAAAARETVAAQGRFAVALSGGTTPRALFERLAGPPWRHEVPWSRAEVFWGDERWVPPDHPESNYRMARAALLDPVGIPPERVHRIAGEAADPAAAAAAYEAEIARVLGGVPGERPPVFDLVLLGMGADGHTASLFPGTAALAERRRWVVANAVPGLGTHRITLTLPILNRAARVLFLVAGADKAATLREVLEGPVDPQRLPAQAVRPEAGHLVWLVDRAAAAALTSSSIGIPTS